MADYDYKAGKQRLEEILDNNMEVVEQDKLPNDDDFTFRFLYKGIIIKHNKNRANLHENVAVSL